MRLIDADSMKADLLTVDPQYETMIKWCITVLDAQQTIEERKTGKWITQQFGSWAECSECHELYGIPIADSNFCPNCGADMRCEDHDKG